MVPASPPIRFLQSPTQPAWLDLALANLDEILLDHAHCERKAAGVALNLICRYPSTVPLVRSLTAIAREELEHFDQVNQILLDRGIALRPLVPPPYGAALKAQVRRSEPDRLLDSLLVAALIEARSHERLGLLGQHCPDVALARFYRSLMASEARHYGVYWVLATTEFDRDQVEQRLETLAQAESEALSPLHPQPRIHS
ncbi:tRNA-(ms[2]io[6]A)-hydroxylase [Prochlorothrix hollandica]|uniref:Hydroxylase n=1 Tax=Prochlorothrix hollandica PCC 9006 = CALU 1027 TaxID=317619 RepID=A0A0M2PP34_PROHO|nr:tRNA-(ms[2]io[6]A)-hydroxylase [Prochlorothrix hollandica]KKI98350.1 hydroxylase [Prochlorothrix hollandica PCC 9006 = CALU 1027]